MEGDVGLEPADGGQELARVRLTCLETFRVELLVGDFVTGTINVTMPEMPFDSAQGFKQVLSGLLVVVFEPLHELAKDRDAHGDIEPVEDRRARRCDHFRERADFLPAVGDEGNILFGLDALLLEMVENAPLQLAIIAGQNRRSAERRLQAASGLRSARIFLPVVTVADVLGKSSIAPLQAANVPP